MTDVSQWVHEHFTWLYTGTVILAAVLVGASELCGRTRARDPEELDIEEEFRKRSIRR